MGLSELQYFYGIDIKDDGVISTKITSSQWKFEPIILNLWEFHYRVKISKIESIIRIFIQH